MLARSHFHLRSRPLSGGFPQMALLLHAFNVERHYSPGQAFSVNRPFPSVNRELRSNRSCDNLTKMMRKAIKSHAIVLAAWLPFFAIWVLFAMSYAHYRLPAALATSM